MPSAPRSKANARKGVKETTVDNGETPKTSRQMNTRRQAQEEETEEMENQVQLQQIIQLLSLKIQADEVAQNTPKVSIECFGNVVEDFDGETVPVKNWIENFELNADAYGLNERQKYSQARSKMTKTAQLFFESELVGSYDELKAALLKEFKQIMGSAEVHEKLANRKKLQSESFHEYILQMKKIAALGNVETKSVIRYIVKGLSIKNEYKFIMHACTTYDELKERYENFELVDKSTKEKQNYSGGQQNHNNNKKAARCFNCGSSQHMKKDCDVGVKCFKCGATGHISTSCPQSVNLVQVGKDDKRLKSILINGVEVTCLVDTGADVSIVKHSLYKKLVDVMLSPCHSVLRGLGNTGTVPLGVFTGAVQIDDMETMQNFIVVADEKIENDALLGYDFLTKFKFTLDANGFKFALLSACPEIADINQISIQNYGCAESNVNAPPQYAPMIRNLIEEYQPTLPLAESPVQLRVVPDEKIKPFRHQPSRHPPVEAEAIKKQVDEWLKGEIVRPSTSSFASRTVVVKKKDGTNRICIDYRQLNSMVLKDCFPVPIIEDVLEKLQAAKVFVSLDLENGYFHVPVEESSRKYTAFITKEGLYEFNRTPFGFCNSPAAFIRFINHIFQDFVSRDILQIYMDDIIIYGQTNNECIEKLKLVLSESAKFGLRIKWKKCHFLEHKINFLGHTVQDGKIWPGKEKTVAVKHFAVPKNVKAVQSFLGLTGFFRKFVKDYSIIARPLTNLLKKDATFKLESKEYAAIENLKSALCDGPVLRIYCRGALTELHTDASKDGFGATLLQYFEDQLHPIFYWSKKTSKSESGRNSYILEVKAAYLAMKKFRHYLLGVPFKLVTDNIALTQTIRKRDVPREVAEWILYMADFDFKAEHRAGEKMRHVDCLSRYASDVFFVSAEISCRLKAAQQKDEYIQAICTVLEERPYNDFKLKGGILFKLIKGNDLLVVPKLMEREIISEAHGVGHFASQKTIHSIEQQFWIPHLESKVTKFIRTCIPCIISNKKLGKQDGLLCCIEKGDKPLHTLHADHLGPMDASSKQYKYILALVDGFSKFVWIFTTKSTGADEVVKKMEEWSKVFGNPTRIITDRGVAFTSDAFHDYAKTNGIEHVLTTTGVPRGNGQVERINRSILSIICKLSAEDSSKWYKFTSQVQKAMNSHISCSTKKSPFEIMFGLKMKTKLSDRLLELLEIEMLEEFDKEREALRQTAKEQIQKAQDLYKKNYDKKRKGDVIYKEGDLVAVKRTQFVAGKKLASTFLGPYEVTKAKRNDRYEVRKAAQGEGPNKTHTSADNMKLWKYAENNEDDLSSGTDDDEQDGRM